MGRKWPRSAACECAVKLTRFTVVSHMGVMVEGLLQPSSEGTMQGGPLSPLLANVLLDDLDKELAQRGLHFVRYADDFLVFVRTELAAQRVFASVERYLTTNWWSIATKVASVGRRASSSSATCSTALAARFALVKRTSAGSNNEPARLLAAMAGSRFNIVCLF